jgi:hypothetical protein
MLEVVNTLQRRDSIKMQHGLLKFMLFREIGDIPAIDKLIDFVLYHSILFLSCGTSVLLKLC